MANESEQKEKGGWQKKLSDWVGKKGDMKDRVTYGTKERKKAIDELMSEPTGTKK